jgi:uncharacterized coiled-coil DUF342 family protein
MPRDQKSDLVLAAEALDEELFKFERAAGEAGKTPLDSRKNIARTAEFLKEVVTSDERLRDRVSTLVAAISAARERQQALAEKVHERAVELQGRTELLATLLQRYDELGTEASGVTQELQKFLAAAKEGKGGDLSLEDVKTTVQGIADRVQQLAKDAGAQDFSDISKEAESVRQQLLGGMNKVELLQKKLS